MKNKMKQKIKDTLSALGVRNLQRSPVSEQGIFFDDILSNSGYFGKEHAYPIQPFKYGGSFNQIIAIQEPDSTFQNTTRLGFISPLFSSMLRYPALSSPVRSGEDWPGL